MKASAISRMKVSFTLAAALCEEEGVGVGWGEASLYVIHGALLSSHSKS
jgi:hypothetical protein